MTASSPSGGGGGATSTALHDNASKLRHQQQGAPSSANSNQQQAPATPSSGLSFNSSAAFQQVKQTQASLARLCRVHQLQQSAAQHHQHGGHGQNQSSQQQQQQQNQTMAKSASSSSPASSSEAGQQQPQKPTTFVDCLIRRFKNCFSEDSCMVPMFVVGNLSPGSDGTHLILPPCVSLGRQSINRFSSPKNLRLMNSIRESCRSIEELDLGDNKLTDLIEVYKILQCMPNLRFLNLSENDLSRTSPVAMASSTSSSISSGPNFSFGGGGGQTSALQSTTGHHHHHQFSSSSSQLSASGQRSCLAPINQNHQQHLGQHSAMMARRHSTLGQSTVASTAHSASAAAAASNLSSSGANQEPNRPHPSSTTSSVHHRQVVQARSNRTAISRVAEVRRLAAASAVAQSKKTSSSVASKLAASSAGRTSSGGGESSVNAPAAVARAPTTACGHAGGSPKAGGHKQTRNGANQRHQVGQTSTMHLARSLSSLSAKDLRAASSGSSRLSAHRSSIRTDPTVWRTAMSSGRRSSNESMRQQGSLGNDLGSSLAPLNFEDGQSNQSNNNNNFEGTTTANRITTSTSHQKLFVEPIAETEDVDMSSEQQVSPSGQTGGVSGPTTQQNVSTSSTTAAKSSSSSSNTHTGNPTTANATAPTTSTPTTLRSVCNSNNGLLSTIGGSGQTNFRRTFESIKALALNNTGCQWKVVCSILSRMPNLEELHLSLNNYERIDLEPNDFKHLALKRLYLCNNPKLTNWEELDKLLVAFPSLEALSIADCNISQIPDNLDRAREWRKLCGLNINGWPIKEWPVVERLNQLPSLIDLKCRNLDVLNSIDEPRHHLIARLPKLQRLNGSEIEEREHAEKAFLRFFMVNSHLERPSRFHELMQVYGEVPQHVDVDVDLSPPSQASVRVIYLNRNYYRKENEDDVLMSEDFLQRLMDNVDANNSVVQDTSNNGGSNSLQENMEVAEVSPSQGSTDDTDRTGPVRLFKDDGQEVVALEVDLRQSVRKFKSIIASIFGLNSQNLILYYIDHEMVGLMGPELIKHNQKKLWNYNVQDGDQFIVEDR